MLSVKPKLVDLGELPGAPAMAGQPSNDDVEQLLAIFDTLSRDEAIRRLKSNNNDVNSAANELFDDPHSTKYKWEESAFSSDRDGGANNAGISFQVQGPDDPGNGGIYNGAPSRPPSRSSNRSPLGRVISLAAEHAAADPRAAISQEEMGDLDLQRALAESAEEAGLQPQQYGVTNGSSMPYFGPANQSTYDESQWGMVLGNSSAHEILPDPEPADRRRHGTLPAFLKPSVEDHRLAALLTIYHEIPLARELFLSSSDMLPDYGHDPEWWAGKVIETRRATMVDDQLSSWAEASQQDLDNFVWELQRLMAFLDKTNRSYGSVDALAKMNAVALMDAPDTEQKFFEAWKQACVKADKSSFVPFIFTDAVQPGDSDDSPTQSKYFAVLDLNLPHPSADEQADTLYDLADQALWAMSRMDAERSAYLSKPGEVVAFKIGGDSDECKMVSIPSTWYPDRYLKENREVALEMRDKKAKIRASMERIDALQRKLTYFNLASGKTVKVQDLLGAALMHDVDMISVDNVVPGAFDAEIATPASSTTKLNLSAELRKVMQNIDRKLQTLDQEKEKARSSLRELSKLYTEPSEKQNQPPVHKYTLRGVSVNNYLTYIKRKAEPDLIDMDLGAEVPKEMDEWWKIEYFVSGSKPVNIEKITENEVLLSAYRDSKSCTVVYASEKAMSWPNHALPAPLENFVRADNLAFSAEFPVDHSSTDVQMESNSPRSPPKRKFDESSAASGAGDESPNHVRWGCLNSGSIDSTPPPYLEHNVEPVIGSPTVESSRGRPVMAETQNIIGHDLEPKRKTNVDSTGKFLEMEAKIGMPSLVPTSSNISITKSPSHDNSMNVDDLASPSFEKP